MNSVDLPLAVFIVDDEAPARHRIRELLSDCSAQLSLELVGEASNGLDALEQLTTTHADVVLVDIRMPQMDGIELAQHLNKLEKPPVIVFTTAYDNYAIQAFEQHAIDYLLKPIRLGRLFEALSRARAAVPVKSETLKELMPEPRKNLSIQERGKILLIPIEKVLYLRAELKYITVRTAEREYLAEEPLGALEKEFATRFVRIHRNCLVAKEEIESFEKVGGEGAESHWTVKLKGLEEKLPISRRQQYIVKEFKKH
ncbi:MAG: DNA-binding response regulator [Gallionellales bacterium 35-53-114]|jgi:two-component system response regulator AlgR|nr:MAG: DNA-binding response regulator [Gallionellales bacterium 35-53-114]OYZ64328.1 MAG: DNA-binding response regulator [Gallionellales bacterium 24-53-125]OZB10364.1 MAG: DNA-binding response regulator [Gallionellales bacterium 39-52-133]HQS56971.1 LytTR family DNA-binding domain-containing protein [Gallionellaceae bacterium]HQS75245.1 LytTR family DNA-binding domain-containing protein [Gallionellaceae bacterium]